MPLPEMHGRTHIPSGYAMVVKPSASSTLITQPSSSDAIPATIQAAPPAAVVEWIQFVSTTNLTGGLDTLSWTLSNGNYNSGAGKTFDIPGTNPQICRTGIYLHNLSASNLALTAGVQTVIRMDFTNVSGPAPASTANAIPGVTLVGDVGPVATESLNWTPHQQRILAYTSGAFSGTPSEFQVVAQRRDDGVGVADSAVTFSINWIRLGDPYS